MKRKETMKIGCIIVLMMLLSIIAMGCGDDEKKEAKKAYEEQKVRIEQQLGERENEIKESELLLKSEEIPLDKTIEFSLQKAIDIAKSDSLEIPSRPREVEDIYKTVELMKGIDITEQINDLKNMQKALTDSRKQYKMLISPTEEFVVSRLKNVENIDKIEAATEEHDPNGNLNKPGGYIAQIYFSSPLVKDEYGLFTGDVIEDGTDCGGSIEVYKTVAEANKRNEYLSAFDGGFLGNGSHTVYGTIIIRTSEELAASQQKNFESEILSALTKLE